MLVTAFISLWISNTAASSMMLPIVIAIVKQLIKYDKSFHVDTKSNQVSGFSFILNSLYLH